MSRCTVFAAIAICLTVGPAVANPKDYLKRSDSWFAGDEAKQFAANILTYQSKLGGWPKNESTTAHPYMGDRKDLKPTYDNKATTDELRFLARITTVTKDATYLAAFNRGLDYILNGQYANGGWPQHVPHGKGYARHITFNDNSMVRLLQLVRDVAESKQYDFVDEARRKRAATAFKQGIDCILNCQIKVDGKLTAWCAQHDEIDFRPQSARTYELATLSGAESVAITQLLMSLDAPSPKVVQAVDAAVAWFESAKLTGIRVTSVKDEKAPKGKNIVVSKDATAPPLWARFYTIETNAPIFVDRDGVPKPNLADIGYERRNGYVWYGDWPQKLIEVEYPAWKKRIAAKADQ